MNTFTAWWPYRDFVVGSIRRDLAGRYRGSLLGKLWVVIQPLAMILIYTLVFSRVMHSRLPGVGGDFAYSIFLCAGLLPWGFFSDTLARCQNMFLENSNLIKKSSFPRICLPIIVTGITGFNFLVIFSLFLLFLLFAGLFPGGELLLILPVLLLQTLLALGFGIAFGVAHVFFRDAGQIVGLGLQFGFWFTPIVYPPTILPEWAYGLMAALNPMAGIVGWYQNIFLSGNTPELITLLPAVIWTVVVIVIAWRLHAGRGDEIVDML